MKTYTETLQVDKNDLFVKLEGLTGAECYDKYGLKRDETIVQTFKFPNGKEVDVKLVVSDEDNETWYEGILFDENGNQLCYTECEDSALGEWHLEDNEENIYEVTIEIRKLRRTCITRKEFKEILDNLKHETTVITNGTTIDDNRTTGKRTHFYFIKCNKFVNLALFLRDIKVKYGKLIETSVADFEGDIVEIYIRGLEKELGE